jgi:uncharacterized delta-60 repeat protein
MIGGAVDSLALQPDGKVLVGLAGGSGMPPTTVVRLNANGSIDSTFTGPASAAGASLRVVGLAVQGDGRVLVLTRSQITGNAVHGLMRLNSDGSPDPSFSPVTINNVSTRASLALQADGRIIIAGQFSAIGGSSISNLARLESSGAVDASWCGRAAGSTSSRSIAGWGSRRCGSGPRIRSRSMSCAGTDTNV